jgi:protoheme IX farnesyltransferase
MDYYQISDSDQQREIVSPSERRFRILLIVSAIVLFFVLMLGYVVRFTENGSTCPDWPTCYGQLAFPESAAARLDIIHRVLAGLGTILVFISTMWAFVRTHTSKWLSYVLTAASLIMLSQIVVGRVIVLRPGFEWSNAIHQALALLSVALISVAAVGVQFKPVLGSYPVKLKLNSPLKRTVFAALAIVFVLMISGALLTGLDAGQTCSGWPLCGGELPHSGLAWLAFSHRIVTLIAAGLIISVFFQAWRRHYRSLLTLTTATASAVLFVGQVFIGALKVVRGFPADLVGIHAASAAGLWTVLVILNVAVQFEQNVAEKSEKENLPRLTGSARVGAFLALNKPIIVTLLLVTTYAGMVVGGRQIPGFWLTFWTLLGGALAAGGASALNQYIDRTIDSRMQRTAKRPIPSGKLAPAEALAYGIAACLAAFFLLAGMVNLLAAVLSLAGMIYYVLLYSILLKKATVQNIVIGGGAGAIPPLVGWAAATGSLNVPSLFLFALVFMWTPPHFWALALVRSKDYARAGVPMLPVVKGEKATRTQIFIYTLELVGLTLLMPVFNVAGSIFLISALVLGLWLIYAAWNVLRKPGNKVAFTMYRYSSMYLAFIFLALVLDVLI